MPELSTPHSTKPIELTAIPGGFHLKMRDDGQRCIDIMEMLYNYRIVLSTPDHMFIDVGFCYYGHSGTTMRQALANAVMAANLWDGYGEPIGYDKKVGT